MKNILCCPNSLLPTTRDPDISYFVLYSYPSENSVNVGHIAPSLPREIRKTGLTPSVRSWDFATIAFSIAAADRTVLRSKSADGWTRMIELSICLIQPDVWADQSEKLESLFRFLTGDFWVLHFLPGGEKVPKTKKPQKKDADCVCLLSGGIDSLVGAIDLLTAKRKPLFVSQIVRGDRLKQKNIAIALRGEEFHFQWSFSVSSPGPSEKSTRGRSLVFFAFAALVATAIPSVTEGPVDIIVPENGFISLNIPLGPGRLGSLSTKTTHPIYMNGIQSLWDAIGINVKLHFPYRYKTKGDLLIECSDQTLLKKLIGDSTSCGKYQRHKLRHCGQCVPCMVRRAAFLKAGLSDTTVKGYFCEQLSQSTSHDVAAAAAAVLRYHNMGVRRFSGGALCFASFDEQVRYEELVAQGMDELSLLLSTHGVL